MIVSHKHKFIFIKTQKTAGTSIEIALSSICGAKDIITPISQKDENARQNLGFRGPQNFKLPFLKYSYSEIAKALLSGKRIVYYNHMSASEVRKYLGEEIWEGYFKFCFERHPYDKVISLYYHETGGGKSISIYDFIQSGGLSILKGFEQYSKYGEMLVDKVYPYEDLNSSLKEVSQKIGLDFELKLPEYQAKSQFRKKNDNNFHELLTDIEKQLIVQHFFKEFEKFGYQK